MINADSLVDNQPLLLLIGSLYHDTDALALCGLRAQPCHVEKDGGVQGKRTASHGPALTNVICTLL